MELDSPRFIYPRPTQTDINYTNNCLNKTKSYGNKQLTKQLLTARSDAVIVRKVTRELNWSQVELVGFCVDKIQRDAI